MYHIACTNLQGHPSSGCVERKCSGVERKRNYEESHDRHQKIIPWHFALVNNAELITRIAQLGLQPEATRVCLEFFPTQIARNASVRGWPKGQRVRATRKMDAGLLIVASEWYFRTFQDLLYHDDGIQLETFYLSMAFFFPMIIKVWIGEMEIGVIGHRDLMVSKQ